MEISITLGEILSSLIAGAALIVALLVAKSQIALNAKILLAENLVAVDAIIYNFQPVQVENITIIHSRLHIQNISKSIIYLKDYTFNGNKYPNKDSILPPNQNRSYYIELPDVVNGNPVSSHVHIDLVLIDINQKKYSCSIFVDFINNEWIQKVERCIQCN
jgi:hypothetical protein